MKKVFNDKNVRLRALAGNVIDGTIWGSSNKRHWRRVEKFQE